MQPCLMDMLQGGDDYIFFLVCVVIDVYDRVVQQRGMLWNFWVFCIVSIKCNCNNYIHIEGYEPVVNDFKSL